MSNIRLLFTTLLILCATQACAPNSRPSPLKPNEVLVRVGNASDVPLRIRLCGDSCTAYVTASPRESVELRFDTSRQNRFVVAAMEGDRMAAQQAFIADAPVLSLTIQPPRIERLPYSSGAVR